MEPTDLSIPNGIELEHGWAGRCKVNLGDVRRLEWTQRDFGAWLKNWACDGEGDLLLNIGDNGILHGSLLGTFLQLERRFSRLGRSFRVRATGESARQMKILALDRLMEKDCDAA